MKKKYEEIPISYAISRISYTYERLVKFYTSIVLLLYITKKLREKGLI